MRRAVLPTAAFLAGLALAGCTVPRDPPAGGGEHPAGWLDPASPSFHARRLRATGDDLAACQACHGSDFGGGAVGVGCSSNGCHTRGVTWCGTCHGDGTGPRPPTGAHERHAGFCAECHRVPANVAAPGHLDGAVEVAFSGLAVANGASPTFTRATKQCANTYCHAGATPTWQKPAGTTPCNACHEAPPASHQRWSRVAALPQCGTCHPTPPDPRHLDAKVELAATIACDTCHGHGPEGAPPVALDGSSDPTTRGAGAHRRHLDETLDDRIGRVVPCERCHPIPASVTAPGHLDTSAPADVVLPNGGSYDPMTGSCVVGCHWDRDPGPAWTDASGAARACDACHGFPPVLTRDGTPHTTAAPTLTACLACHVYTPTTHVDGHVDLVP